GRVERNERTGGVETEALDRRRRDVRNLHDGADSARASAPDIRGRLLDDVAGLVPDGDRVARGRKQRAMGIERAGTSMRRPDIDADEDSLSVAIHHAKLSPT